MHSRRKPSGRLNAIDGPEVLSFTFGRLYSRARARERYLYLRTLEDIKVAGKSSRNHDFYRPSCASASLHFTTCFKATRLKGPGYVPRYNRKGFTLRILRLVFPERCRKRVHRRVKSIEREREAFCSLVSSLVPRGGRKVTRVLRAIVCTINQRIPRRDVLCIFSNWTRTRRESRTALP